MRVKYQTNIIYMKKISILLLACGLTLSAHAVMSTPELLQHTQPDGTTISYRLVGDEFFHYMTTTDGYIVDFDAQGALVYEGTSIVAHNPNEREAVENGKIARLSKQKKAPLNAREHANKPAQQQIGGGFPLTGSPRALVILVGFSDLPFEQTKQDFDDLLNKSGYDYNGATGSCRDYFIASSDSVFQPQFDVYGPYTASHDMKYYGEGDDNKHDANPQALIIEACQLAAADGVNFADYDTNGDNILDNVFVYYAGHNQAEGGGANTIWPHQSNLSGHNIRIDEKRLATYACTSEYRGAGGKQRASIGTFCHEFGHVLGLPDFYDTNYKYYSVGNWDIMCSGSYNNSGNTPPVYTSYERFYLGWLKPIQLTAKGEYFLEPLEISNTAFLIAASEHNMLGNSPSPTEFFMLENRQHEGWDTPEDALPGTGLLVWHIDYSANAWSSNTPNNGPTIMRMHLEEANGITWKSRSNGEPGRSSDPYPGTMNITTFTPTLHNGTTLTQQHVFDISENKNLIQFTYIASGDSHLETDKKDIELVTEIADNRRIVTWEPQSFTLTGKRLAPESSVTLSVTGNFSLAAAEEAPTRQSSEWNRTITLTPAADSTLQQKIWVSFVPTRQNCEAVAAFISISGDGVSLSVPVAGTAPRPKYVTIPTLKPTSNVSPYSFTASWEPVNDAEEYYITLYSVEEGISTITQSFENFGSQTTITEEGWESNTTNTTTSIKADGSRSLLLKNSGDCITSEVYPSAITTVSFWLNAFTTDIDTVGYLDLEVWNGTDWEVIGRTYALSTTKKKTITYEFEQSKGYIRFRLTYTDFGSAGLALDMFAATCTQNISYIYRGRDLAIQAINGDGINSEDYTFYNLTGLTPATTYFYQIQCSDLGKGCQENLTDLSEPVQVVTPAGVPADDTKHLAIAMDSLNFDAPTCVVYVPTPSNDGMLYIFDAIGHQVYSCRTFAGTSAYAVPVEQLVPRNTYIIKYVENSKMKRKQRWVKFIR